MSEVFEFWAGNPSVEVTQGVICAATSNDLSQECVDDTAAIFTENAYECAALLASSVPCYMSAPEFCGFLGAFTEETHRHFKHCRVLRGSSAEEYLVAIWLTSKDTETSLLQQYNGRRYNSIEEGASRLHRIVGCKYRSQPSGDLIARSMSPSVARGHTPGDGHASPSLLRNQSGDNPLSPLLPRTRSFGTHTGYDTSPSGPSPRRGLLPPAPDINLPELPPCALSLPCDIRSLFPDCGLSYRDFQSVTDVAKCPVCLEHLESDPDNYELTELGGGVPLTILCGHTFHARCLFRWCDTTCPVCRYQQHPSQISCCDLCGQSDGILICLVCGNIGCQEHALHHYEEHQHTYALDMTTQRVWDFAGKGYVHRLLTNQDDGKVVEHSGAMDNGEDFVFGGDNASSSASPDLSSFAREHSLLNSKAGSKKSESVVSEFNMLLASQMTAQRRYYDEENDNLEAKNKSELEDLESQVNLAIAATDAAKLNLSNLVDDNASIEQEIRQVIADEETCKRQMQSLKALNKKLSDQQQKVENREADRMEHLKVARQERDKEVEELQQQIRDLELFLQMRKKCTSSENASEFQESHLLITESTSRGRGRGGRRPKRR